MQDWLVVQFLPSFLFLFQPYKLLGQLEPLEPLFHCFTKLCFPQLHFQALFIVLDFLLIRSSHKFTWILIILTLHTGLLQARFMVLALL